MGTRHLRAEKKHTPQDLGSIRFSAGSPGLSTGQLRGPGTPTYTPVKKMGAARGSTSPGSQQVATVLQGQIQSLLCGGSDGCSWSRLSQDPPTSQPSAPSSQTPEPLETRSTGWWRARIQRQVDVCVGRDMASDRTCAHVPACPRVRVCNPVCVHTGHGLT